MKFAHLLLTLSESNPEFKILHTIYKAAKKALKRLPGAAHGDGSAAGGGLHQGQGVPAVRHVLPEQGNKPENTHSWTEVHTEAEFAHELVQSINQLDVTRAGLQGQCAERLTQLQQCADNPQDMDLHDLYREAVRFHGEVLLVMNWSLLAYTMCLKILKKHHKRTGLLLQAPELRDMLSHPSWSTEGMAGVATAAEALVTRVQQMVLQQQEVLDAAPQLQDTAGQPSPPHHPVHVEHVDPAAQPLTAHPEQPQLQQAGDAQGAGGPQSVQGVGTVAEAVQGTGVVWQQHTQPVSRRRPATPSHSGSTGPTNSGSGQAMSQGGGDVGGTGVVVSTRRQRKKSHWDPGVVDAPDVQGGGTPAGLQRQQSQEEAALSEYARHAAAQQASLKALRARHVSARMQAGRGRGRHLAGQATGGVEVLGAAAGAGPPVAAGAAPPGPQELPVVHVPSWQPLELLSRMQTSSCDSDEDPSDVRGDPGAVGALGAAAGNLPKGARHGKTTHGMRLLGHARAGGVAQAGTGVEGLGQALRPGELGANRTEGDRVDAMDLAAVTGMPGRAGRRRAGHPAAANRAQADAAANHAQGDAGPEPSASGSCSPNVSNSCNVAGVHAADAVPEVLGRPLGGLRQRQRAVGEEDEVTSAAAAGRAARLAPAWLTPATQEGVGSTAGGAGAAATSVGAIPGAGPAGTQVALTAASVGFGRLSGSSGGDDIPASDPELVHQMRLAMQAWEHITGGSVTPSTGVRVPTATTVTNAGDTGQPSGVMQAPEHGQATVALPQGGAHVMSAAVPARVPITHPTRSNSSSDHMQR